ncbi:hypothetical protein ACFL2A_03560 [Thermodesulfobacteriota bacterium]
MRLNRWQISLGIVLISASVILYFCHYLIFNDPHHIFIYLVGDIAFVPFEVLLVTVIIHKLLEKREKQAIMEKLNILVGVFFSEVGSDIMKYLIQYDQNIELLQDKLTMSRKLESKDFQGMIKFLKSHKRSIEISKEDLEGLAKLLKSKRYFLVTLLQNPVLLEHESFSELLRSLFHLEEEFTKRLDIHQLCDKDYSHIKFDIWKSYKALLIEWVEYMEYLKNGYPYLFSFTVAINPLTKKNKEESHKISNGEEQK